MRVLVRPEGFKVETSSPWLKRLLWLPGVYDLPRLFSLSAMMIALFSLLMNWALPERLNLMVPSIFRAPAAPALSFLLLALNFRLTKWEPFDFRSAHRARLSRICAAFAALLTLLETVLSRQVVNREATPILLALEICMLAAASLLQASRGAVGARRVLLTSAGVVAVWLCLGNLYAVDRRIGYEFTSDPSSAVLALLLTAALAFVETRNRLVPLTVSTIVGRKAGIRLLLYALCVPMAVGYLRFELEKHFSVPMALLSSLHVLVTLAVMAGLLIFSMREARGRLEAQLRLQQEYESSERTFQALLEGGSEVFLTMDREGRILTANENAIRCLGIADPGRALLHIDELIRPESRDRLRELPAELVATAASNTVTSSTVLVFYNAQKEPLPLYVTAACRMRGGAPDEILLVGRALPLGLRSPGYSDSLLATA